MDDGDGAWREQDGRRAVLQCHPVVPGQTGSGPGAGETHLSPSVGTNMSRTQQASIPDPLAFTAPHPAACTGCTVRAWLTSVGKPKPAINAGVSVV